MEIKEQYNIKQWNTFGMDVTASKVIQLNNEDDILTVKELLGSDFPFVLGGGSNILFLEDITIPILKIENKGIVVLDEMEESITIAVKAGEIWHHFVSYCVHHKWYGVENLSLIPGCVGAAPIQNIGAYGVEVKDVISEVRYFDWNEKLFKSITNEQCRFGYRDSIFKNELKGKVIITEVIFKLSKKPNFKIDYGQLSSEINKPEQDITIADVSNAVIHIRESKLPNPKEIGNAGSFFKNPVITKDAFEQLKESYDSMPFYTQMNGVKIPAAWLIEQCGWKGKTIDNYGVHKKQALVLVNYGGASGQAIYDLSTDIINSVKEKFNIELEREVQVYPSR